MKVLASISVLILAACLLCAFGQLPMGGVTFQPSAAGNTWTTSTGWSSTGFTSGSLTCSPACPAQTITSTVAGDLLYAEAYVGGNSANFVMSSINNGGTWVFPANCKTNSAVGTMSCGYVLSATGSVTSLTVTLAASASAVFLHVRSYHPSSTTAVAETVPAAGSSGSCSNNCATPTVTLTGSSDLIVAAITTGNTGCSVASPYGRFSAPTGDGFADQFNATVGTGATFTQGTSCPTAAAAAATMTSVAFK